MTSETGAPGGDLSRRSVIRRAAVVGATTVWATPTVQSIASPAFAAGTPKCVAEITAMHCTRNHVHGNGKSCRKTQCIKYVFTATETCCDCLERAQHLPRPLAILACKFLSKCQYERATTC